MSVCTLRLAEKVDIYPLVDMSEEATKESGYKLPFSRYEATNYLWQYINHPECDIILGDYKGALAGVSMLAYSSEFHEKPFCYVAKFWVLPSARRTRMARDLLNASLKWAVEKECSHVFVTAAAGLDEKEQRLFINLMKRVGFKDEGPMLWFAF